MIRVVLVLRFRSVLMSWIMRFRILRISWIWLICSWRMLRRRLSDIRYMVNFLRMS